MLYRIRKRFEDEQSEIYFSTAKAKVPFSVKVVGLIIGSAFSYGIYELIHFFMHL